MILITGGLGYLGGRIANYLVQTKNIPIVLGTKNQDYKLPYELRNCEVIQLDLLKTSDIELACEGITSIIHLAAINFQESQKNPRKASAVNNEGTYKLLQSAVKSGVKQFVYFSTAHVYGSPLEGDIDESSTPKPVNPYSMTHLEAEEHVLRFHSENSINGIVLRLSNAIGKPMDKDVNCWMLVANAYCKQAIVNREIILNGDPNQQRDFISISHIETLVNNLLDNSQLSYYGAIMNVGSERSLSILDLAKIICERCNLLFGFKPEITINEKEHQKRNKELNYNCRSYKNLNLASDRTLEDEIDELLKFCGEIF